MEPPQPVLVVLLSGVATLAVATGVAADVGVGYQADADPTVDVDAADRYSYTLEVDLEAAEGEDRVEFSAAYADLSEGAIAPWTTVTVDGGGGANATLGPFEGFDEAASPVTVDEGKHQLEVQIEVPNRDGNHTAHLQLTARSPTEGGSSASAVYGRSFSITPQHLDYAPSSGDLPVDRSQRFEATPSGTKTVDEVAVALGERTVPMTPEGGGTYAATASTCGAPSYQYVVTYENGVDLRFPADGPLSVEPTPPPEAGFSISPPAPEAGESITFQDESSSSEICPIVERTWILGDGNQVSGSQPTHTYGEAGSYNVTLTVEQAGGVSDQVTRTLAIASGSSTGSNGDTDGGTDDGGGDGSGGSDEGGSGDATGNETTEPSEALRITSLAFREEGTSVEVEVNTNRPAEGTLTWSGPAGNRTRGLGPGTSFSPTLEALSPGTEYRYELHLVPTAGLDVRRSGTYVPGPADGPAVVKTPASEAFERAVQGVVPSLSSGGLYKVDADGDGEPDRLDGPGLESLRVVPRESLNLLRAGSSDLVLADLAAADAFPVEALDGNTTSVETTDTDVNVTVRVPAKAGWIYVNAADERPDADLQQVLRDDGREVPLDRVWREETRVHLLDDPGTAYHLLYQAASTDTTDGVLGLPVPGIPGLAVLALAGTALAAASSRGRADR